MITLRTITTIELSNKCNLSCAYCVNRLMPKHGREYGIMDDYTFEKSLELLKILCTRGTQREVNLNGTGESCLDPQLPKRIRMTKDIMGSRKVNMCTNGVNLTPELAREIKNAGIDQIDLSPHSPAHARRAARIMAKEGLHGILSLGAISTPHNWAGQLEPHNTVEMGYTLPCDPLLEGRGYIAREGWISPCCYDFHELGKFGTVLDADILDKPMRPFSLCATCHQVIPDWLREEAGA